MQDSLIAKVSGAIWEIERECSIQDCSAGIVSGLAQIPFASLVWWNAVWIILFSSACVGLAMHKTVPICREQRLFVARWGRYHKARQQVSRISSSDRRKNDVA
jgi:hypothetical protein